MVTALREALAAGESVTFTGFGSFKVVERAARKGRNPRTGEELTIPASTVANFPPATGRNAPTKSPGFLSPFFAAPHP